VTFEFEEDITNSLRILKEGGVILYPTDTVWGLGCDATNASAVKRIYEIKKRADEKAMIILVADERDVLKHVASPIFQFLIIWRNARNPLRLFIPAHWASQIT